MVGPTVIAETLSLALVLLAFIIMTALALRARSTRSLQFQLFVFTAILVAAEIPRILESVGLIVITEPLETGGLLLHTVSMAVLSGFVAHRTYRFLRG
jgi:hypothetical protein